jgi:hypothetical protein
LSVEYYYPEHAESRSLYNVESEVHSRNGDGEVTIHSPPKTR